MRGTYVLISRLDKPAQVAVKSGRLFDLDAGYYAYVGSALSGLKARLKRHFATDKRPHWHIDYLLQKADAIKAICVQSERRLECNMATHLAQQLPFIDGFGASDCGCNSHLFYATEVADVERSINAVFDNNGLVPLVLNVSKL